MSLAFNSRHSTNMLVNFSRVLRDLVPSEERHQIEWRVRSLTTYLVHVSHEKSNSMCCFCLICHDPSLFLYPSIKTILICALCIGKRIISALKGSLPVFHDQGREHSEQFLWILIITRFSPWRLLQFHSSFKSVHDIFHHRELNIVFFGHFRPFREDLCVVVYIRI
jgi:hypothetical protein